MTSGQHVALRLDVSPEEPVGDLNITCVSPNSTTDRTFCHGAPLATPIVGGDRNNSFNVTFMPGICWGQEAKMVGVSPSAPPIELWKFKSENYLQITWNGTYIDRLRCEKLFKVERGITRGQQLV